MTTFVPPQQRATWQSLQASANQPMAHLRELLKEPQRAERFQLSAGHLHLDFSRQRIDTHIWSQLQALATESDVLGQAHAMARGDAINATEARAVLHMALRGANQPTPPWGQAISAQVTDVLKRMLAFADTFYNGTAKGHTGEAITDVVNLGIGGSDLGPRMAAQALAANASPHVRVHFVSNPDAWALHSTLRGLNPATTLVVVSSKTFTTQETLTLANSA
ncbi:MAG: glucose-6-phosphate isomerase, partial [Burkholderiaceae bacterium]